MEVRPASELARVQDDRDYWKQEAERARQEAAELAGMLDQAREALKAITETDTGAMAYPQTWMRERAKAALAACGVTEKEDGTDER